jgi:small-conductance mechanosensitive channel
MRYIFIILIFLSVNLLSQDTVVAEVLPIQEEVKKSYIDVSDIPSQNAVISEKLKEIQEKLEDTEEILDIDAAVSVYSKSIKAMLSDPTNEYLEYVSIQDLKEKEKNWRINIDQLKAWNIIFTERIDLFDENYKILEEYLKKWKATKENALKQKAPEAILKQINDVITSIEKLKSNVKKRYDKLLTDANIINKDLIALNNIQEKTKEAMEVVSSKVFYQNDLSFFDLLNENEFNTLGYLQSAYNSIVDKIQELIFFYTSYKSKLIIFAIVSFFIVNFVFLFNYLYKTKKLFVKESSYNKKAYFFILHPFSTSLISILLFDVFLFDIPEGVQHIQLLIILIPVFIIFQTQVTKNIAKYFYIYLFLYIFNMLVDNANGYPLDGRVFSILLSFMTMIYIIVLYKNKVFYSIVTPGIARFINKLFIIYIFLLLSSIIADVYGATLLASNILKGVFISFYSSMIFYVLTLLLTGYIVILLRKRINSVAYNMVENFTANLERTIINIIRYSMLFWWFLIISKSLGIYTYIIEYRDLVLALSWEVGNTTISVSSVLDFLIIIIGTWFVVKIVNIILQVEVFARIKFPRGIPTAITTVLNYMIVISGGIIALSSLGVTAEQFALVFGALGVGIGFGLRNIIANFISGIIMVFERPIQIGDTIEINNTSGKVQGIGTRSSTIKTFDGSEVIIPNADFIAKEITNWTLSDEYRRKTLSFKVELDSDIDKVLVIMKECAKNHKNTLSDPEPVATFLGFGEYYLEFKLYFWLNENLIVAPSDIAIDIYKTLQKEGIKMPLPKQQLLKADKDGDN